MKRNLPAVGLLSLALSGCISSDIPKNNLPDHFYEPAMPLADSAYQHRIISIRYPAGVEKEHKAAIAERFADHTPYMARMAGPQEEKMVAKFKRQLDVNPKALQQTLEKTSFYALYLYQAMNDQLAESGVKIVLEPTILSMDKEGKVFQKRAYLSLPADACLNFISYVDPYFHPGTWSGLPATYGKGIAPIVSLRVDQQALPDSQGLYAATTRLMNGTQATQADAMDCNGVSADIFSLLNRDNHWDKTTKTQFSEHVPRQYPYFILKMDSFETSFPAAEYLRVFALDSQTLLSGTQLKETIISDDRYADFIARFDTALANRWRQKNLSDNDQQAVQDIESFRLALGNFAVAKSQVHFDLYLATNDFSNNQAAIIQEAKILRNANLMTGLKVMKTAFITDPIKMLSAAQVSANELTSSQANLYLLSGYKEVAAAAAQVAIPVDVTLAGKKTRLSETSMAALANALKAQYNHTYR